MTRTAGAPGTAGAHYRDAPHVSEEDCTDTRRVVPGTGLARAVDLLELNPGGLALLRLSVGRWAHVDRVAVAMAAASVSTPRQADAPPSPPAPGRSDEHPASGTRSTPERGRVTSQQNSCDGWTPQWTAAVDPQVAAWEARPADPDGTVEKVAQAIGDADYEDVGAGVPWDELSESERGMYRRAAVAALQVVKAPAGDPQAAVCPTCENSAGPYRCCPHCAEDPGAHENGQRDHHDVTCSTCIRAALSGGAQ